MGSIIGTGPNQISQRLIDVTRQALKNDGKIQGTKELEAIAAEIGSDEEISELETQFLNALGNGKNGPLVELLKQADFDINQFDFAAQSTQAERPLANKVVEKAKQELLEKEFPPEMLAEYSQASREFSFFTAELFEAVDKDKNGVISKEDLDKVIAGTGVKSYKTRAIVAKMKAYYDDFVALGGQDAIDKGGISKRGMLNFAAMLKKDPGNIMAQKIMDLPLTRFNSQNRTVFDYQMPSPPDIPEPKRERLAEYAFAGSIEPAERCIFQVGNRKLEVIRPLKNPDPPNKLPTEKEIAQAFFALPPFLQNEVHTIVLNPVHNPVVPNALMTADWFERSISVYPNTFNAVEGHHRVLFHEIGHIVSGYAFDQNPDTGLPDGSDERWKEWQDADPGRRISDYATTNRDEDFAEMTELWFMTQNTPQHEEYRAMFPQKFAILDRFFKK